MRANKDVTGDGFQGMAMTCGRWCDCKLAPDVKGWSSLQADFMQARGEQVA